MVSNEIFEMQATEGYRLRGQIVLFRDTRWELHSVFDNPKKVPKQNTYQIRRELTISDCLI